MHWKGWCWSWSSNTLDTWYKELIHWKRPGCWEKLKAIGEGGNRIRWLDNNTNSMDCSPPGSSVHGISQARILEWVAISFSKGSSQPRGQTCISCLAYRFFTTEPPGKPLNGLLVSKTEFLCFLKVWAPRFRRLEQEDSHRLRTRKPEPTSPVCHSQGVWTQARCLFNESWTSLTKKIQ